MVPPESWLLAQRFSHLPDTDCWRLDRPKPLPSRLPGLPRAGPAELHGKQVLLITSKWETAAHRVPSPQAPGDRSRISPLPRSAISDVCVFAKIQWLQEQHVDPSQGDA